MILPNSLLSVRWRRYDLQRQQWRAWEHVPFCLACDGLGNSKMVEGASCPCGGWADEIDDWAGVATAEAIRRRRDAFAARLATADEESR